MDSKTVQPFTGNFTRLSYLPSQKVKQQLPSSTCALKFAFSCIKITHAFNNGGKWLRVWRAAVKFVFLFNYINTCPHRPAQSRPFGNMECKLE